MLVKAAVSDEFVCPAGAIKMVPAVAGDLMLTKMKKGLSTAQLKMGSGTSGCSYLKLRNR